MSSALSAASGGDTISVGAGTYNERVVIDLSVTIVGAGATSTVIDGDLGDAGGSVVEVSSGATVTIRDLMITGGAAPERPIPASTAVYVEGGGAYNEGTLTLDGVTITDNDASSTVTVASGGGVANRGTMTLSNTTVTANTADRGAGVWNRGATLTIMDSTITSNIARSHGGGGIASGLSSASVTVLQSTIAQNSVAAPGTDQRGGGGIWASASDLTVEDSDISDNSSGYSAGGIYVSGSTATVTIRSSTISRNRTGTARGTGGGGGISARSSADVTITDSTISGNVAAGSGGGIDGRTPVTIVNSTISGNTAAGSGGGIDAGFAATLRSVSVVGNSAANGGGVAAYGTVAFLDDSLVADNSATTDGPDCIAEMWLYAGEIALVEDATACTLNGSGTYITGVDPQLGPLADNGGPTRTHLPAATSPVIDAGVTTLTTDQRGEPRPSGAAPDIGSVEVQVGPSAVLELLPDWAGLDSRILARSQPINGSDCGWVPGETVDVVWDEAIPLQAFTADGNGCFEGVVLLDGGDQLGGEPLGRHKIVARGQTSSVAAQAPFDLVRQQLRVTPATAGPASPVALAGCGWDGATTVNVYWLATGALVGKGTVDANGCIDTTGTIPRVPEGFYALGATAGTVPPDGPGGSSATLIEVRNAYFDMTPSQGPPGQDVDLNGCNWHPGSTVSFTWMTTGAALDAFPVGPDGCLTSVITDAQGRPLVFVEIPLSAPEGDHVIRADGELQRVDRTFTVTEPGIILDPIEGPPDTVVEASGCGWGENDWVDLTWQAQQAGGQSGDYPYLGRATVDQNGCFGQGGTFTFQVPGDTVANETVRVLAENGIRQAEAEFYVAHDGTISIDPSDADVEIGQTIAVSVLDAIVGETISFSWDHWRFLTAQGAATRDFTVDVAIPLDATVGNHTISAHGTKGFGDELEVNVIDNAAISTDTSQPLTPGASIVIEGSGFAAGDEVNFWVRDPDTGSGPYMGQVTVPADRTSFIEPLDLPLNLPPGPAVIAAVGDAGHTAYVDVTIGAAPLTLRAIEVTQAVQTLVNDIDLFDEKKTVVRVYIDDPTGYADPYTGSLVVYRGGVEVGSIEPVNGPLTAPSDSIAQRGTLDATLNFVVPFTMTSEGQIGFSFELDPTDGRSVVCREYGDSSPDCGVIVAFQPSTPAQMDFYAIPYWTDEVYNLIITPDADKTPGGSLTITVDGETTAPITEFTRAAIKSAIVDLDGFEDGEVAILGIPSKNLSDGQLGFRISIRQRRDLPAITADGSGLVDASVRTSFKQNGGTFRTLTLAEMMEQYLRIEASMPTGEITPRFYFADTLDFTPNTDYANKKVLVPIRNLIDGTCPDCLVPSTRLTGLMKGSNPYSTSIGNSQGLTLAAFDVDLPGRGDTGYARNNAVHETYHSYGKEHAIVQATDSDGDGTNDETIGLCGSWGPLSGTSALHPYVEEITGNRNWGLELTGYANETWPTLGPLQEGPEHEVWGFDTRFADQDLGGLAVSSPYDTAALMSYCGDAGSAQEVWPSRYGYLEVADGLAQGFIGTEEDPGYVGNVMFVSGTIDENGSASIDPLITTDGALATPDGDPAGDSVEVVLLAADGTEVSSEIVPIESAIQPNVLPGDDPALEDRGSRGFSAALPADGAGHSLVVRTLDGNVLATAAASQHAPWVELSSPGAAGPGGDDALTVMWRQGDEDGDDLRATVFFSDDDGESWRALALGLTTTHLSVDRSNLSATPAGRFKVVVSDGFLSAEAVSDPFEVVNRGPLVEIVSPTSDATSSGVPVLLDAAAWDVEDGILDPATAEWTSDLAGALGTGSPLRLAAGVLDTGCHLLTVRFEDSGGAIGSATVALGVDAECGPEQTSGTVRIVHRAPSAPERAFSFSSDLPGADHFDLADAVRAVNAEAGRYVVTEDPVAGSATTVSCADPSGDSTGYSTARTAVIALDPGEIVECVFVDVAVNAPPTIDVQSSSVQYSDAIEPMSVTVADVDSSPPDMTLEVSGLPDGLSATTVSCLFDGPGSSCSALIAGTATADPGEYRVTLTASDGIATSTVTVVVTVLPEDATVRFHGGNPVAVRVETDTSGPFEVVVRVTERTPDAADGEPLPGELEQADVSVVLQPIGPGGAVGAVAPCGRRLDGTAYDQELTVTCAFDDVPVDAYSVAATVGGAYAGTAEDVVVVYDPSSAYAQGGGRFVWPDTDDTVRVGFSMEYNKKGTNVKGGLMLVRSAPDGSTYVVKSNALYGLALSDPRDSIGWASFAGKATFDAPWLDGPEGNHEFIVYAEDGEADRFWIEVRDKDDVVIGASSLPRTGAEHAVPIIGDIVIPHGSVRGGRID